MDSTYKRQSLPFCDLKTCEVIMAQLKLYKEVALTKDIPTENLRKGDVATLIDRVPHPSVVKKGLFWNYLMPSENLLPLSLSLCQPLPRYAQIKCLPFGRVSVRQLN